MEFTGERFLPTVHGNIELEHLHRYLQVMEFVRDKEVLDIACGEGYGSAMIAKKASKVTGVDISKETILHARRQYTNTNLEFLIGDCVDIPLPDSSIDVVVSFETIEHINAHDKMMREIKRVLRSDGLLIISSPDKYYYTNEAQTHNPFHEKELYEYEFKKLIANHFKNSGFLVQRVFFGSHIIAKDYKTSFSSFLLENGNIKKVNGLIHPHYWLAFASDIELPELISGSLEKPLEEYEIILEYKKLIQNYELSNSWRITRPLRKIAERLRRK